MTLAYLGAGKTQDIRDLHAVISQAQVSTFSDRSFHREVTPVLDMGMRIGCTLLLGSHEHIGITCPGVRSQLCRGEGHWHSATIGGGTIYDPWRDPRREDAVAAYVAACKNIPFCIGNQRIFGSSWCLFQRTIGTTDIVSTVISFKKKNFHCVLPLLLFGGVRRLFVIAGREVDTLLLARSPTKGYTSR